MICELLMKAVCVWNKLVVTGRRGQYCHGDGSVPGPDGHGKERFVRVLGKARKKASLWW